MKKKFLGIAAMALSFSLLLSSCSLFGGSKKKDDGEDSDLNEDIVEVVEGYFGKLKTLSFSKLSKYTEESKFGDLAIEDDAADVLEAFLAKMKVSVAEAEGKEKKGEGTATVKLTYVDLEKAFEDLDDPDVDDLIDAINAKKAKTAKKEIELDLVYDDEWKLENDDEIYKFIYKEICTEITDILDSEPAPTQVTEVTPIPTDETSEPTETTPSERETTPATSDPSQDPSDTKDTEPSGSTKDTTTAPDIEKTFETKAGPGISDRHIVSADDFDRLMKEYRFTSNDESQDGYIMREYTIDADDMYATYLEFADSEELRENQEFLDEMIDEILYEDLPLADGTVSDRWDKNTHNVYSQKISSMDDHSIDVYVYRDATTVAIIAIDEYPNADVSVDYYLLIEKLGIWDFDIDID